MRLFWASLIVVASGVLAVTATASVSAHLDASLTPDTYGANTGIVFSASISRDVYEPPLTEFRLYLPAGMRYKEPTLGLPTCQRQALETAGIGCPSDSRIGGGELYWETSYQMAHFTPKVSTFLGQPHAGRPTFLFYTDEIPEQPHVLLTGALLPARGPFGAELEMDIPVPDVAPDVIPVGPPLTTVGIHLTFGPTKLTLTRHVHHKLVHYHPPGILMPRTCPHNGFPFLAQLTFQNGETAEARATVPCPPGRAHT